MNTNINHLEDLEDLSVEQLYSLYRSAKTPKISDLEGQLSGKIILLPKYRNFPAFNRLLSLSSQSEFFPWKGKVFHTISSTEGIGNNILSSDKHQYNFKTSITQSYAGQFDAMELNYSHHQGSIRLWRDEIREIAPNLWLGLAYKFKNEKPHMFMYFALERKRIPKQNRLKKWAEFCVFMLLFWRLFKKFKK